MKTKDAIRYFGNPAQLAKALKITTQAVTQWGEEIPQRRQYEIERLTGGRLKPETSADLPDSMRGTEQQGEGMQDHEDDEPEAQRREISRLSSLVAELQLLIEDMERVGNAYARASLRVQYHQAMADLLDNLQLLAGGADGRTETLRQRHVERAVEYQRELDQLGVRDG